MAKSQAYGWSPGVAEPVGSGGDAPECDRLSPGQPFSIETAGEALEAGTFAADPAFGSQLDVEVKMRASTNSAARWEKVPTAGKQDTKEPQTTANHKATKRNGGGKVEKLTFLPVAWTLCRAFDSRRIRYGVFQDVARLPLALAGRDDLDILLEKADYPSFCTVMSELQAVRGVSLASYDNVCAGREDWFVPDFLHGGYLHLDLHVCVRVGWEFCKRYPVFDYASIRQWDRMEVAEGLSVSVASPEDETRAALARLSFRVHAAPWTRWITVPVEWKHQFARFASLPVDANIHVAEYIFGQNTVVFCRIHHRGSRMKVHRRDLAKLRSRIRTAYGYTLLWTVGDPVIHFVRKATYLGLRLLAHIFPELVPPKRRPSNGGVVVALIAPDGLGKSTQVERLTKAFARKFGCRAVYVGTGTGKGWWFRKGLQFILPSRRKKLKAMAEDDFSRNVSVLRRWRKSLIAVGLACWGILVALERRTTVRRAHRLATRGFIVICDRWPQALQQGYLDGPVISPNMMAFPGLAMLERLEQRLYREMGEVQPNVTLHLVANYATSAKRKPGEISKEGFNARLSLMESLRKWDQGIHVVDASGDVEIVNRKLYRHIWQSL